MSVINTNVKSLVAQDAIMKNNRALSTSMQRLSTGSRINSAKDDAAGLAISTRMDSQVRGLNMAIRNANDGISLMQTAEGAMDEVTNILQRMRELSVQSVNGTNNDSDRVALNDEITQLKSEIDRIASTTEFNNQKILNGSFKDKKLQIGDKAYQTMDVAIGSVATKDLGMASGSFGSQTLVGQRVALASFSKGDIEINGQELAAFDATTEDLGDLIDNINQNIDNVTASAFNVVVAKQVGDGVTTDGQFRIQVKALGAASATEYAISASSTLEELAANINREAGTQVQASINDQGKLVLSNNTGATISVNDTTETTGYETGSGFSGAAANTTFTDFKGFLKLDSDDGNPIRIERGNLDAVAPGALADLAAIGFREVTSQVNNALDAYTVTGKPLDTAGVTTAWAEGDLKINGVDIYDEDIATTSFQGKLDAINNFSDETGVIAYAYFDKTITFTAGNFGSVTAGNAGGFTAGNVLAFNGTNVYTAAANDSMATLVAAINGKTSATGITATADGFNLRLTGSNVSSLKIDTFISATGTAGTMMNLTDDEITYAGIRLDSAGNQPISIELDESNPTNVGAHGFLEQNVGAADFEMNDPTMGVGSGQSLVGLNISTAKTATAAITTIDNAIEKVSEMRSKLGAMENRLTATVNNLSNIVTNTQASRSRIQDTDYASETTALAKAQIISQAATAMLAQANQQPQSVLSLLK
jgi:flagellin